MLKIKKNYPIANLSAFKIGGRARYFCEVKSDKELFEAINVAKKLKVFYKLVAGGSNVLFPDGILNYMLIKAVKLSSGPSLKIIGNKISVDAGVELLGLIKKAVSGGLQGLETLSGIPGTVGGAVVGNAGAYGHSISEVIEKIEIWNGRVKCWFPKEDCKFGYRHSIFKEKPFIVLRAVLKFKKGDLDELKSISRKTIETRLQKYKPNLRCAGSFFKNVPIKNISQRALRLIDKSKIIEGKLPAGYLLEQVGAKGMKTGGIKVADFHSNFLINSGRGKASDVKKLAEILKNSVNKKFGIVLEEEVRYF